MSYLYIPFGDAEGNQDLRRLSRMWVDAVARDTRWKNPPEIKIHGAMRNPLSDINPDESVYVLGHGGVHFDFISNDRQGSLLMHHDQLALRLFQDGLPLRHRKLKLYFCNPFGGPIRQFATRLKEQMWQLNYTGALEVHYYNGSVSVPREENPGEYHKQSTGAPWRADPTGNIWPARASTIRSLA